LSLMPRVSGFVRSPYLLLPVRKSSNKHTLDGFNWPTVDPNTNGKIGYHSTPFPDSILRQGFNPGKFQNKIYLSPHPQFRYGNTCLKVDIPAGIPVTHTHSSHEPSEFTVEVSASKRLKIAVCSQKTEEEIRIHSEWNSTSMYD